MPLSPEDIVRDYVDDGSSTERVNKRKSGQKIAIVEPNPAWPQRFLDTEARIEAVLGSTAVAILHAGSTSVPGLPAKDVIDIDLVVKDIKDEDSYVEALERLGFRFLLREPGWHQHRFFVDEGDRLGAYPINLHVFGPDCPEVEKHRIFREWLLKSPKDLQQYATVKRECAAASEAAGESMQEYTLRKGKTVQEILNRAFRDLGYIK
ncbi:grpb/dephospho-CoA kinase [Lophiotrema nucula]|uniref:Grpb/dephospho-CoA kinase n=1 Tax=Lophiotrema nucula TaxID=690887 RepID=A0A6A5ZHR9_9PLEO|nr:grpb/dephospho-CoA kinase [Lophiotrema nucula]